MTARQIKFLASMLTPCPLHAAPRHSANDIQLPLPDLAQW
jgi:hypothetical protein